MKKELILIVEDDRAWVDNFHRWLGDKFDVDDVANADGAIQKLRSKYYALVLLDLSLTESRFDRSSEKVQKFLKDNQEGTKHIVVSGHANEEDIRVAAFNYNAVYVFFKIRDFFDKESFFDKIDIAITASKKDRPDFVRYASDIFYGDDDFFKLQHTIVQTLKPEKGFPEWERFKIGFFDAIAPIYNHISQRGVVIDGNCVMGLFWSRKLGHAISVCLANTKTPKSECINALNSWLDQDHFDGIEYCMENIKGYFFIEHQLKFSDFNVDLSEPDYNI